MQRELGRFAHRTDEQADADHRDEHPAGARERQRAQIAGLGEDLAIVQGAGVGRDQANAQNEAEVTHAVDQKRLHVGEDGSRLVEPEANQQVGHQAHGLPAEEQLQQVVAHDQHEHGEREQRDVGKEAVVALVLFHVADGVDVNHQGHESHDHHHHRGEAVDQEAHFHLQATHHHPGVQGFIEAGTVERNALERHGRQDERNQYAEDGQGVAQTTTDPVTTEGRTEDAGQHGARQRCQRHSQER